MNDAGNQPLEPKTVNGRDLLAIAVVYLAFALLIAPRMPYDAFNVSPKFEALGQNIALAETMAWRNGQLALAEDFYEDSEFNGKTYSVVGLAFTIVSVPITWIADTIGCEEHFPRPIYYLMMTMPIPIVGYWAIRQFVTTRVWATLLTIGFLCGTPMGPEIASSKSGNVYDINHVFAVTGVFIFAADLLGRRRIWPAAIGLILACWSRQMTCLYAVPLILIAWRTAQAKPGLPGDTTTSESTTSRFRIRPVLIALIGVGVAGTIPLLLNYLKFGNPLDTGYVYLYHDRTDPIAERARSALFGFQYLKLHLEAMHYDYPRWCFRHGQFHIDLVEMNGGSLWMTTPLTIAIFTTARHWWRDPTRRILVLGTLPVIVGLHLYHTTGGPRGMYRYALDFLPIWWLVFAPYTQLSPPAKRLTATAIVYSILYYQVLAW